MNKNKIFIVFSLLAAIGLPLVSCDDTQIVDPPGPDDPGTDDPVDPPGEDEYSATNPRTITEVNLDSEPVTLEAPFTIYTEDGGTPSGLTYSGSAVSEYTFDNMYLAIRIAAQNSTNSKPLQVQDSNYTQIFKRQRTSLWYCFDGHQYVGTDASSKCQAYIDANTNGYAIYGNGSGYSYLGREDYVEEQSLNENLLELNAGAYNYMFSLTGVGQGPNGTNIGGFSYVTATVRMSEMRYKPATDGDGWNAYIFIHLRSSIHADLGLIGNLFGDVVQWRLVRNCSSSAHGSAGFLTFPELGMVNESTKYDSATGEYYGFDDLYFEAIGLSNGWILNITNLRTNVTYTLDDRHYDASGAPLVENGSPEYFHALIASSYCPVVGVIWNWDCGAATTNVLWENITMQRYVDDNVDTYRNASEEDKHLFTPDSEYLRDGYSQGAFAASHSYGVYEEDGTYASGLTYKKGDTYLSQSVSYNNPW